MKHLFFLVFFSLAHSAVYDCFPFFNEFEVLNIRLHELDEVVDFFVLVESIETQRGAAKPLYFTQNKEQFTPFLNKIIHIAIEEKHPEFSAWEREHFQRNQIMRALDGRCQENDVIILSDVDEIPKKTVIEALKPRITRFPYDAYRLEQTMYFFHLNRTYMGGKGWRGEPWWGSIVTSYGLLSKISPQFLRDRREKLRSKVYKAGWHFSYMGGLTQIRQKIESIAEGFDTKQLPDEELQKKIDGHAIVPIDNSFPLYIQEHISDFRSKGFIAQ